MKPELLKILIFLKETSSWDLAESLAIGVYNQKNIELGKINSILEFLNILIKKSNLGERQDNLIKARNMMMNLRNKELEEKKDEEKELETLFNF